jgi:flagellar basal-body rod protein FlgC
MVDAISIALSGLVAQATKLAVSANNIANANTTGILPTAASPVSTVYRPLNVSFIALNAGANNAAGVKAVVTEDANGFTPVFDPSSPFANTDGLVAAPDIDLTNEIVNVLESKLFYKADASVIKVQKEMIEDLLKIV